MIELIRRAPMSKLLMLVHSHTQSALWSSLHAWRERHREASEQEAAVQVVSNCYGAGLAQSVQGMLERRESWQMKPIGLVAAMQPAVRAFDDLGVSTYLAGSIASSLHGMQQLARDVDLVVDLPASSIAPLLTLLKPSYALDEDAMRETVLTRMPCPLIHLDTLLKVDVIPPRPSPFENAMRPLVATYTRDERYPSVRVASASEMILFKLQRTGAMNARAAMGCETIASETTSLACSRCKDRPSILCSSSGGSMRSIERKPGDRRSLMRG